MPYFALTMERGPGFDPDRGIREQDGWQAHAAFMDGLVDEGFVHLGGPVDDGTRVLLAVEAADADAVTARLADDPWLASGHLRVGSIRPWTIWLDSRGS
jgi:uncharacterized protein YciI